MSTSDPPKKRGGNPQWKKGVSGNPGGSSKKQKESIAINRMRALEEMPKNIARLIELRDTSENEETVIKAIKLLGEWAMPRLAPIDVDGETVKDTTITVVVPEYGKK